MPRQNFNSARRNAEQQARINQLDSLGASKSDFFTEDGLNTVEKLIGEFIQRVQNNIQRAGMNVSGRISDITVEKTGNGINVMAYPELIFQDKGVNGVRNKTRNNGVGYTDKRPPLDVIIEWVRQNNNLFRNNDALRHGSDFDGRESPFKEITEDEHIRRVAYAIREKIYYEGQAPKNLYTPELPQLIEQIADGFADFMVREVINSF